MIIKPGVDFTDVNNWPHIGNMTWSGYQKKKLFRNLGGQAFKEIAAEAGVDNDYDGRGVAMADFDNDGRLDIFQTNADQPALLYHNVTEGGGKLGGVKLVGVKSNRDAIGARVTLKIPGLTLIREVNGGNGYSAQSSVRLHFGLGGATKSIPWRFAGPAAWLRKLPWRSTRSPPAARVRAFPLMDDDIQESRGLGWLAVWPASLWLLGQSRPPAPKEEELARLRNLGKALYENPTTSRAGGGNVQESPGPGAGFCARASELRPGPAAHAARPSKALPRLEKAQQQDPRFPTPGSIWASLSRRIAIRPRHRAVRADGSSLVPDEPVSHYNLGYLYKVTGKPDLALTQFEIAEASIPTWRGRTFSSTTLTEPPDRADRCARASGRCSRISRSAQAGSGHSGRPRLELLRRNLRSRRARDRARIPSPRRDEVRGHAQMAGGFDPTTAGLAVLDVDGDGRPT